MKKQLHLCIGEFSKENQDLMAAEKAASPETAVTEKVLKVENAAEILEEIFQADAVCFWNRQH